VIFIFSLTSFLKLPLTHFLIFFSCLFYLKNIIWDKIIDDFFILDFLWRLYGIFILYSY
jgi:hypothetical protein